MWCGVVWCGAVRCGAVRCGAVYKYFFVVPVMSGIKPRVASFTSQCCNT